LSEIPEHSCEMVYSCEIYRWRGELLLRQGDAHALQWRGDLKEGLAQLHEAAVLAEATHAGSTWALAAYGLGHALLSKGEYEAALSWYRRLQDYALAAGDMAFITRSPNIIAGVHLELFDFDEAMRLGAEGDETCRKITPYPEPRAHSLLKVGLGHLGNGELGAADQVFRQIWPLLNVEEWGRWRWHIPLLRACGELALAGRRYDEAWDFATQSLQIATETRSLKHACARRASQGGHPGRPRPARGGTRATSRVGHSRREPEDAARGVDGQGVARTGARSSRTG
jgi:tetratricopeptide (TPR) repeat protein